MRVSQAAMGRLEEAIDAKAAQPERRTRAMGRVVRIGGDGTPYVHLDGGVRETPLAGTSAVLAPGDEVGCTWVGGRLYADGNYSRPATDDSKAEQTAARVAGVDLRLGKLELEGLRVGSLKADLAEVVQLLAEKASVSDLEAARADIDALLAKKADIGALEAESARIDDLQAGKADISDLEAQRAEIDSLLAGKASIGDLDAERARIGALEAGKADIADLEAERAEIDELLAGKAGVGDLEAQRAEIDSLIAGKADIDLANVNNAWIEDGVIRDASITDAQIIGVSANKITAGEIGAGVVYAGTINAEQINAGRITVDGVVIDFDAGSAEVDGAAIGAGSVPYSALGGDIRDAIDGAVEAFTGAEIPTLANEPASLWEGDEERARHVGDVYYVVNAGGEADGHCYRFAYDGQAFSWVLIKDSDVTAALQRLVEAEGSIEGLESFKSDAQSWMENTDLEFSSLKQSQTELGARVEAAEGEIALKVDSADFNELSQTVEETRSSIGSLSETVATKADGSTVEELSNAVSEVRQTAEENSSTVKSLKETVDGDHKTLEDCQSRIEQNATDISSKVSKTDYTGETITSLINQSADSVKVKANHVEISGDVVIAGFDEPMADIFDRLEQGIAGAEKVATNYIVAGEHGISIGDVNSPITNNIDNDGWSLTDAHGKRLMYMGVDGTGGGEVYLGNANILPEDGGVLKFGERIACIVRENGHTSFKAI